MYYSRGGINKCQNNTNREARTANNEMPFAGNKSCNIRSVAGHFVSTEARFVVVGFFTSFSRLLFRREFRVFFSARPEKGEAVVGDVAAPHRFVQNCY